MPYRIYYWYGSNLFMKISVLELDMLKVKFYMEFSNSHQSLYRQDKEKYFREQRQYVESKIREFEYGKRK